MTAITDAELKHRYTVATGPGGSTAGTGAGSLGGFASSTEIPDAAADTLWDAISGDENAASEAEYRCEVRHNTNAANVLQAPKAWISSEVAGGANIAIGVDPTAASAYTSASAQTVSVANENTAPAGVTFSSPTTKTAGLALGDIGINQVKGLWWRRTATNSGAMTTDGAVVTIEGDTGAL